MVLIKRNRFFYQGYFVLILNDIMNAILRIVTISLSKVVLISVLKGRKDFSSEGTGVNTRYDSIILILPCDDE